MIHLFVTQLLLAAAAIASWRTVKVLSGPWLSTLLLVLAMASSILVWPQVGQGAFASAALAAMVTSALWLPLNAWKRTPLVGALAATTAFVLMLPLYFIDTVAGSAAALPLATLVHVIAATVAFAAFSLAAMQSVVVVWLSLQLKGHRLGDFPGAGSLEHNERAWLSFTRFAWLMVLLAILSGLPSVYDVFSQHLSHKIFFAVLAWLLLSALLLGRRFRGWRDKTAARWVVGGWAALWVAWLGTKLVLQGLAAAT